ncbi:MAG: FAD-dependent oxidoreductase, partial [Rhodospirillales bacterium]|nr:FAD-dependent oxidoreductase [Rhodospirillales bacterium]
LRQRDQESRITIITAGRLLFLNRYKLPSMLSNGGDWRDLLVHAPSYYDNNRIVVRRNTVVTHVDAINRSLTLGHKETIVYDKLLVASGGSANLPTSLADFRPLLSGFHAYREACKVRETLPKGGRVVMLGGDVLGLDLARHLIDAKYSVTLIASEHLFWPHQIDDESFPDRVKGLRNMGIEVIEHANVERIEEGAKGMSARRVLLNDGREIFADAVMPFFGLVPIADFMLGSGVDMERGLLVKRDLKTTDDHIWAAGDVCQIWSSQENRYRFYYGWKNVRRMGEVAARNMTGDNIAFVSVVDESLHLNDKGQLHTQYWEYD